MEEGGKYGWAATARQDGRAARRRWLRRGSHGSPARQAQSLRQSKKKDGLSAVCYKVARTTTARDREVQKLVGVKSGSLKWERCSICLFAGEV